MALNIVRVFYLKKEVQLEDIHWKGLTFCNVSSKD